MKIALLQIAPKWEDRKTNLGKAVSLIQKASSLSCEIAVLPEMFDTGFSMRTGASPFLDTSAFLSSLAREYKINIIAGTSLDGIGGKASNAALVMDTRGKTKALYRKLHPFSLSGEDKCFSSGETTVTFKLGTLKASLFICYDLRFPEVFRSVAKSAQAIFVLANWPLKRIDHWGTLLKARAIENQSFVIGVNRRGKDGNGLHYSGASQVFDPWGKKILDAKSREIAVCEIDQSLVSKVRKTYPFLKDMKYISKIKNSNGANSGSGSV